MSLFGFEVLDFQKAVKVMFSECLKFMSQWVEAVSAIFGGSGKGILPFGGLGLYAVGHVIICVSDVGSGSIAVTYDVASHYIIIYYEVA